MHNIMRLAKRQADKEVMAILDNDGIENEGGNQWASNNNEELEK